MSADIWLFLGTVAENGDWQLNADKRCIHNIVENNTMQNERFNPFIFPSMSFEERLGIHLCNIVKY